MSDALNPYKSPETAAVPEKPLTAQGILTETMLLYLKGASPWLRFIGVLGFVGTGFSALGGVIFLVAVPLMGQVWNEIPGFESFSAGMVGAVFSGGMGVFIIGASALMFFPSLFVYRFGEKIRSYLGTGADRDLEQAFKNNKSLWKFYGIICIIYLAFVPLMVIGGIIASVVAVVA
jgi:hypothetical protein